MKKGRPERRGMVLMLSLAIAFIMMTWAVAATYQANFQSGATLFSYRKSEGYYLAKRGISRSLHLLNINPAWAASHNSLANADNSTPGALSWLDATNPSTKVLRCKATTGSHSEYLSVPILHQTASSMHVYSIAPALGGGPDLIAWTSQTSPTWESLPPIPGIPNIISTTATPNGDVYAIGKTPGDTSLWRYRVGQGWLQMPDAPVKISNLSCSGDGQLVCQGANNSLMLLPLGTTSVPMDWNTIFPPSGVTLTGVAANPIDAAHAYAAATNTSGQPVVYQCAIATETWSRLVDPAPAAFDANTGAIAPAPAVIPNFSGGVTSDKGGKIYAASNPASGAAVVYAFQPAAAASTAGTWTALPAVPALEWSTTVITNPTGYATNLNHIKADNEGKLWAQWNNPATGKYSVISMPALP